MFKEKWSKIKIWSCFEADAQPFVDFVEIQVIKLLENSTITPVVSKSKLWRLKIRSRFKLNGQFQGLQKS